MAGFRDQSAPTDTGSRASRAQRRLRKILRRGPSHEIASLVADHLGFAFLAVDALGDELFRSPKLPHDAHPDALLEAPIRLDAELMGHVYAPRGAEMVAKLIACLAAMDGEAQGLAGEALLRYKELNLLYALIAKLALRPRTTAEVARLLVDEAQTLISADILQVYLHDPRTGSLRPTPDTSPSAEPLAVAERVFATGKAESELRHTGPEGQAVAALCVPISTQSQTVGVLVATSVRSAPYTSEDLKLATALALVGALAIENARFSEAARRFVPTELLDLLGRNALPELMLGDQIEGTMTVLFCDIRGFTTLIEQLTPEEGFAFINRFLAFVGPVVREHSGFVDKYLGDAVMAVFPADPADAIAAGVAIQHAVRRFSESEVARGAKGIGVGVGIHAGVLRMGVIGEAERWSGTVIGDAVNVAARLESLTRIFDADILISEAVHDALAEPTRFGMRRLGSVHVKGKAETVSIFEVYDADPQPLLAIKRATRDQFDRAVASARDGNQAEVVAWMEAHIAAHPDDKVARRCLDRWRA